MRILFVIGKLEYSGAENVLRTIAPLISGMGNDVYITLRFDRNAHDYNGIPVFYYGGNQIIRLFKLRRIVSEKNIDAIVSFGFPYNLDCALIKRFVKARVILCERHDPSRIIRTKKQIIGKKLLYPMADGYVVQTKVTKQFYLNHFSSNEEKVHVIPNPVREIPRECVSLNNRRHEIVTVGRYDNKQKNHIMLIRAFSAFHKNHSDYVLRLYGEGPDRELYQKEIRKLNMQSYIVLMGYSHNPIADIADADVFCLTSNYEGMPNALIEAMSLGLPCISTKCGGGAAEELINSGENGLLIDMNAEDQLIDALNKIVDDRGFNQRIGVKAREVIITLSKDRIAIEWEKFIQYVVG